MTEHEREVLRFVASMDQNLASLDEMMSEAGPEWAAQTLAIATIAADSSDGPLHVVLQAGKWAIAESLMRVNGHG